MINRRLAISKQHMANSSLLRSEQLKDILVKLFFLWLQQYRKARSFSLDLWEATSYHEADVEPLLLWGEQIAVLVEYFENVLDGLFEENLLK